MKNKILYFFSDTGGGHRSAASAIIRAVDHLRPDTYAQEMMDVFLACSGFLNIFARLYGPVIKYSPRMWGQLYYWLDDEKKIEQMEKIAGPFILKELKKLLVEKKPSAIVSVHPMVNHLTVRAIKELGMKIPLIVVITDPVTLHRAWIVPQVDQVIVATPEAKQLALKYGMPEQKIKVIGMPIDPRFFIKDKEKEAARKKDHLKPKLFTVLMMGGGEGAGKMFEIVEELDQQKVKVQLIIICGRNKSLENKLKKAAHQFSLPMRVYGFTDKVHEIMAESDLIVTKAGPGTIAEALSMDLPIIITSWLPGQEEGNVEFVVRENVGRVSRDPKKVVEMIKEMLVTSGAELKKNIKRVAKPKAALEIAREIFRYL